MHYRISVRLHFRRSGLDVPSDTRDRKPDQCVGKRIAEVVVQSDSNTLIRFPISFLVPAVLLFAAGKVHPAVRFLLETFWCYQIFAARCLVGESRKVYQKLKEDDLPGARRAVSMIVGRDTENLTAEGVTKAAVETVAENTSDGVTAPLRYYFF